MSLYIYSEDVALPSFNFDVVKKVWIDEVRKHKSLVGKISYIFCSDAYILQINKDFLKHDYFTDVITFDYSEGRKISGDIFISIDSVMSNAKKFRQLFSDELIRVMAHGLLHLLKYNDKKKLEIETMRKMETELLRKVNLKLVEQNE